MVREWFGLDDDDDDFDGLPVEDVEWDADFEMSPNPDDWDSEYITEDDAWGTPVNLPYVDYETGLAYCSDAPEGVLKMRLINPEEDDENEYLYEICRTDNS